MGNMGHRARDPTPDEIRERCRAIRDGWTDDEFARRLGERVRAWTPPVCEVDEEELEQ